MGTPFTTYSGWSLPPKEEPPRMMTRVEPAAPDAGGDTFTPAILPVSALPTLAVRTSWTISPLICWMEYARAFFSRLIPKAVTTTSSSTAPSAREICRFCWAEDTATDWEE